MMTRQLTMKELALLILLLAGVAAAQAELTHPHLTRIDGWVMAAIFDVVYAVIGGIFASMASSARTL
jgi:hypothetical protein